MTSFIVINFFEIFKIVKKRQKLSKIFIVVKKQHDTS